ncbi:MAG: hypothetical protein JM58_04990 [Peptococcaceae bacterium BICA1-8]|nr:MAG: hypothetical protein JM58_04990 [Peptococcaceae bacterium BICA1-8]
MPQNIWDFWANRYEKLWVQKYSLKPTRDLVVAELQKYIASEIEEELNLLDVGCGTGQLLEDIKEKLCQPNLALTGIDSSEQMIAFASKKLTNARVIVGDALALPFSHNYFDFLTCCHSFPYYQDKLMALQEFKRVLKPGGVLFLVQASENNVYDKVVMKLVKLTTGKAAYPSKAQIRKLVQQAELNLLNHKKIESQYFMPSIILSTLQNGDKK